MIYNTYHLPWQRSWCFCHPPHVPICLQPQNDFRCYASPDISTLDVLANHRFRHLICEYAAMLWVWHQKPTRYIGFTSWRQRHKCFKFGFRESDVANLSVFDCVAWGTVDVKKVENLHLQAEKAHPGIVGVMQSLLEEIHGQTIPATWLTGTMAPFSNYWAMRWESFDEWMAWSWPLVELAFSRWAYRQPFGRNPKSAQAGIPVGHRSLSYLIERLFQVWLLLAGKTVFDATHLSHYPRESEVKAVFCDQESKDG